MQKLHKIDVVLLYIKRETYLHTQCQTGLIPAPHLRIFGTPRQYPIKDILHYYIITVSYFYYF